MSKINKVVYSEEQQDLYYLQKYVISIIFDTKYNSYKNTNYIYDIEILNYLKGIVKTYVELGCFNSRIKTNIYKILVNGRKIMDENYEQRIQIINEIIGILNSQKEDNSIIYYRDELYDRRKNIKELKYLTEKDIVKMSSNIEKSIYNDFLVLNSHSKSISDEDFDNVYLPYFINNNFYYESMNIILDECPSFFKDEVFIKRVNKVISNIKNIDQNFRKTNKKVKKMVKKINNLN